MMAESAITISKLAAEFGVTTRTIRFYEDQGLLSPKRRGSQRIYNVGDRIRLKLILRGKRLGFTLAESKELINLYDPTTDNSLQLETLLRFINTHKQRLAQQLQDIKVIQQALDKAEERCRKSLKPCPRENTSSSEKAAG